MKKTWGIISEMGTVKIAVTQVIADSFNDFLPTIGERSEQNIRKHNGSHFHDYLTSHTVCHLVFHLINNNDTLCIIKKD